MIRVLEIISDTNIGGGGVSLLNYLKYCDRSRFQISVVLPRGSALVERIREIGGVELYEIDAMADKSMDRAALKPLRELIRKIDPQLVHTHGSLVGRIAAHKEKRKVIYTKHCAFAPTGLKATAPGRFLVGTMDKLLSDGVIAVGPSGREILRASGIADDRIYEMLNGVEPLPQPTPQEREEARAAYGFQPEDFVLGILARVEEYKGHQVLLDGVKKLIASSHPVRLLVAGDGSYMNTLKEQAKELPEGTVVFAGFVRDVKKALWAMDLQVNASTESETSSLSLLEGMSIGLPALVSDIGGNPSLILDGENGFVFPNRDSEALAEKVVRFMESPQLRETLSSGAKEIFNTRFTGEIFAKNIENVYLDVLKGATHGTER